MADPSGHHYRPMKKQKVGVLVHLDQKIHSALKALAAADRRSMAGYLVVMIEDKVKQAGGAK